MKTNSQSSTALFEFLRKYTMVIALVVVFILFAFLTDGRLVYAQNLSNLMLQNGYVLVMACGMLLCILTGGNIDLSIGSVICMVGGLAAVMISDMSMNPILAIVLCLAVGLLVGVWQGYWIGYVRIPPFITTLGGMFIFRGLGRLVLDNQTVAIQDSTFLNIFTAYINIPGLDDGDTVLSALIVGVVAAVYVILNTVKNRRERAKKGYRQNSAAADYLKAVIIAALILAYCYMLSQYRGISVMLVWVLHHRQDRLRPLLLCGGRQREGHPALRHQHQQDLLHRLRQHGPAGRPVRPAERRPRGLRQRQHRHLL